METAECTIHLSREARTYILFQRTNIDARTIMGRLCKLITTVVPSLYKPLVSVRAAYHGAWIDRRFNELMNEDYETMRAYLPHKESPVIIDIGCGVAGIDVLLSTHYGHRARIVLVDKTQTDENIHYGFEKVASFYNNLFLAKEILNMNGVPESHVVLNTPEQFVAVPPRADLVISLESWGFHYPISTYIDTVKKCIKAGGLILVEVRKSSGALEELQKHFTKVEVIKDGKRQRILCTGEATLAK